MSNRISDDTGSSAVQKVTKMTTVRTKNIKLLRHLQCSAVRNLQEHTICCDINKTKERHTLLCTSMR